MTPFEYVTVLISIILGMGITQIVTGVADIIHQWERVRLYWPHLLWVLFLFFLHIQEWWSIFELRPMQSWYLGTFLFIILYPINLFILARILFPFGSTEGTNFREFYFANYRKFFFWAVILPVLSIIDNVFINGYPIKDQVIQILLIAGLGLLLWKDTRAEWVHQLVVILLLVMLLMGMIFTNAVIQN